MPSRTLRFPRARNPSRAYARVLFSPPVLLEAARIYPCASPRARAVMSCGPSDALHTNLAGRSRRRAARFQQRRLVSVRRDGGAYRLTRQSSLLLLPFSDWPRREGSFLRAGVRSAFLGLLRLAARVFCQDEFGQSFTGFDMIKRRSRPVAFDLNFSTLALSLPNVTCLVKWSCSRSLPRVPCLRFLRGLSYRIGLIERKEALERLFTTLVWVLLRRLLKNSIQ